MPGEQIKRWGFNDYRGLSTTALLYHTAGKIDSKNKVLDEIRVVLSWNTGKTESSSDFAMPANSIIPQIKISL